MSEKIALLSDIHGNTPALHAVLEEIKREPCDRIYVLGDIFNGIDPKGCVELIRSIDNVVCIRGNAEAYLLTPDLDEFPQRHEPLYADLFQVLRWWESKLTQSDLEWLGQLPDTYRWNGTQLVHDSPFDRLHVHEKRERGIDDKYRELALHGKGISLRTSQAEYAELFAWMETQHLTGIFCGHSHEPLCRWSGDKFICNVGSAGFTLDGNPRPSWVLFEPTDPKPTITIHRVEYDIDKTLALIDATPDHPGFDHENFKRAYKMMYRTGVHWKAHLK
jgi:predicted phosphodiesterase